MRIDATLEELQSDKEVQEYISKISKPTGINFWDTMKLNKELPKELPPCNNCPNNVKNGGNGICACIMEQRVIN